MINRAALYIPPYQGVSVGAYSPCAPVPGGVATSPAPSGALHD